MRTKTGRYSGYIRPFAYLIDLIVINIGVLHYFHFLKQEIVFFMLESIGWFTIAASLGFYEVYRYTKVLTIINCAFKQWAFFSIYTIALLFFYYNNASFFTLLNYSVVTISSVLLFKLIVYFFLREYRLFFGGNFRQVVLLGNSNSVRPLQNFFTDNLDYGYKLIKTFPLDPSRNNSLIEFFDFILENKIDELYCAMSDLTHKQIRDITYFADNNMKTLKFIPDQKQLLTRNFKFEYYDYIPVISPRQISLDTSFNKVVKRSFDIIFSVIVIVGILSWLTPILAVIIKMESRGALFFKQKRNGLNYQEFYCYKFRSMQPNDVADINQVSKNDKRITKIGSFIRKTSIDELPQFFNVLLGNMSVVGPRPHMVSHTEMYAKRIDKFKVRHFIKPGITGLAQTKGFRGEVETDEDIINRVKYDIFYLENWSFMLDVKIVFQTVVNIIKGDEKAY